MLAHREACNLLAVSCVVTTPPKTAYYSHYILFRFRSFQFFLNRGPFWQWVVSPCSRLRVPEVLLYIEKKTFTQEKLLILQFQLRNEILEKFRTFWFYFVLVVWYQHYK